MVVESQNSDNNLATELYAKGVFRTVGVRRSCLLL